jgi:hypothetical protein
MRFDIAPTSLGFSAQCHMTLRRNALLWQCRLPAAGDAMHILGVANTNYGIDSLISRIMKEHMVVSRAYDSDMVSEIAHMRLPT